LLPSRVREKLCGEFSENNRAVTVVDLQAVFYRSPNTLNPIWALAEFNDVGHFPILPHSNNPPP
jgi:hypothetical protein